MYVLAAHHTWIKNGLVWFIQKRGWEGFVMTSDFSARFIVAISIGIRCDLVWQNKCWIPVCLCYFLPKSYTPALNIKKLPDWKWRSHFLVLITKQLYVFIMKLWIEQVASGSKKRKQLILPICALWNCYTFNCFV